MESLHCDLDPGAGFLVFLNHANVDKPEVRKLCRRLRDDGVCPWLDEEELLPGQDWRFEIERVLRRVPSVIVCLSRNCITKVGYVQKEMRFALDLLDEQPEGSIFVIPVRLEECLIPDRLKHLHYCDVYNEDGYQRLLRSLRFIKAKQLAQSPLKT